MTELICISTIEKKSLHLEIWSPNALLHYRPVSKKMQLIKIQSRNC